MSIRGLFLSSDDRELQLLSKKANERLVRLEKWQKEHDTGYSPAYEQAKFYQGMTQIKGKAVVKRFKEDVRKMTAEEKAEQKFKVTAFLNNPLSQRKELNRRLKLEEQIRKATGEEPEKKGLFEKLKLSKPDTEKEENQFWTLFDLAKARGLNRTFDYKTLANLISWKMEERSDRIFRRIAEALLDLKIDENLTRRALEEAIQEA